MTSTVLRTLLVLLPLIIFLQGCKTSKLTTKDIPSLSNEYLNQRLKSINNDYEWIKIKARIHFKDGHHSFKGTAHIRSKKDSLMWIRFTKLGVEGARMLITHDTITLINRLDKTYEKYSLEKLNQTVGLDVNLELIEDALLANPVGIDSTKLSSETDHTGYLMQTLVKDITLSYHLLPKELYVDRLQISGEDGSHLDIYNDEYEAQDSTFNIPKVREIIATTSDGNTTQVKVKMVSIELNKPTKMSFSIPLHYVRK